MTVTPSGVLRYIKRFVGALLSVTLASMGAAQSKVPRFEHGDCLLNGDWARDVRRECGWLLVPESRDRPDTTTIRLAVEIFRAGEPNGAPPLVLLHGGPGGPGGIRLYSAGVAMSPWPKHRDVVIYDQRGAGLSEPTLCPTYDRVAESAYNLRDRAEKDARLLAARRACIAELDAKHLGGEWLFGTRRKAARHRTCELDSEHSNACSPRVHSSLLVDRAGISRTTGARDRPDYSNRSRPHADHE